MDADASCPAASVYDPSAGPTSALVNAVSSILNSAAVANDALGLVPPALSLTRFHSKTAPGVSIADYFARLIRYAPTATAEVVLTALHLLDLACPRPPSSPASTFGRFTAATASLGVPVGSLTLHRLLLAAYVVASKFCSDSYYSNAHYARVGGVPTKELNCLEMELLFAVRFRIRMTPEELAHCVHAVDAHHALRMQQQRLDILTPSGPLVVFPPAVLPLRSADPFPAVKPSDVTPLWTVLDPPAARAVVPDIDMGSSASSSSSPMEMDSSASVAVAVPAGCDTVAAAAVVDGSAGSKFGGASILTEQSSLCSSAASSALVSPTSPVHSYAFFSAGGRSSSTSSSSSSSSSSTSRTTEVKERSCPYRKKDSLERLAEKRRSSVPSLGSDMDLDETVAVAEGQQRRGRESRSRRESRWHFAHVETGGHAVPLTGGSEVGGPEYLPGNKSASSSQPIPIPKPGSGMQSASMLTAPSSACSSRGSLSGAPGFPYSFFASSSVSSSASSGRIFDSARLATVPSGSVPATFSRKGGSPPFHFSTDSLPEEHEDDEHEDAPLSPESMVGGPASVSGESMSCLASSFSGSQVGCGFNVMNGGGGTGNLAMQHRPPFFRGSVAGDAPAGCGRPGLIAGPSDATSQPHAEPASEQHSSNPRMSHRSMSMNGAGVRAVRDAHASSVGLKRRHSEGGFSLYSFATFLSSMGGLFPSPESIPQDCKEPSSASVFESAISSDLPAGPARPSAETAIRSVPPCPDSSRFGDRPCSYCGGAMAWNPSGMVCEGCRRPLSFPTTAEEKVVSGGSRIHHDEDEEEDDDDDDHLDEFHSSYTTSGFSVAASILPLGCLVPPRSIPTVPHTGRRAPQTIL